LPAFSPEKARRFFKFVQTAAAVFFRIRLPDSARAGRVGSDFSPQHGGNPKGACP
jgi:hypothetical protein